MARIKNVKTFLHLCCTPNGHPCQSVCSINTSWYIVELCWSWCTLPGLIHCIWGCCCCCGNRWFRWSWNPVPQISDSEAEEKTTQVCVFFRTTVCYQFINSSIDKYSVFYVSISVLLDKLLFYRSFIHSFIRSFWHLTKCRWNYNSLWSQ